MSLIHWNYYLSLEEDLEKLSRFIEFNEDNLQTYSIETARILMLATQEVDVLLRQLCRHFDETANEDPDYRRIMLDKCSQFSFIQIELPRYNLKYSPFAEWRKPKPKKAPTPKWWTANNNIKHSRDTKFPQATLENSIIAMMGLLLTNIYYYVGLKKVEEIIPSPKFLDPGNTLVDSSVSTRIGGRNKYKPIEGFGEHS